MTCPLDTSERLCSSRALRAIARFSFSAPFAFFSEYETNNYRPRSEGNVFTRVCSQNGGGIYPSMHLGCRIEGGVCLGGV